MSNQIFDPEQVTRIRFAGADYDVTYVHDFQYDQLLQLYREALRELTCVECNGDENHPIQDGRCLRHDMLASDSDIQNKENSPKSSP